MGGIIFLIIIFTPLVWILWTANMADKQRDAETPQRIWAFLTYIVLCAFWSGLALAGLLVTLVGLSMRGRPLNPDLLQIYEQFGMQPEAISQLFASLPLVGMGLWLPAILGVALLTPPLRRLAARVLAIDPARSVHAVALSYSMVVVVNLWITVAFGIGNLADLSAAQGSLDTNSLLSITWAQEIVFALMAVVGVGWLARRDWRQSLQRLGLVRPTARQVAMGVGIGVVMMLALIPLDYLVQVSNLSFNEDVNRLSEQVIGPLTSNLFGILTLGVAAALGEELLFRGALQPRLGLFFTALLFALLHSTYGLSLSTVIVLLIGLVLGWVRNRYNTSSAMVVHAIYNMAIGLMTYLALWPEW